MSGLDGVYATFFLFTIYLSDLTTVISPHFHTQFSTISQPRGRSATGFLKLEIWVELPESARHWKGCRNVSTASSSPLRQAQGSLDSAQHDKGEGVLFAA
jgi:hypothetical protein